MRVGKIYPTLVVFVRQQRMNNMKRWTPEEQKRLRHLFLREKIPIIEIARRLKRSPASINTILTKFGIPRLRSVRKVRIPTHLTPALARLHAHVCGDGHLIRKREKDSYGYLKQYRQGYYRIRYAIGYTNKNPQLIRSFMDDATTVFGLKPWYDPKKWAVIVKSKAVWELMKRFGAGRSREWFISKEILDAGPQIHAAWIHAFFDDEAHFVPRGGIRVRSVNRPGLEQLARMVRRLCLVM